MPSQWRRRGCAWRGCGGAAGRGGASRPHLSIGFQLALWALPSNLSLASPTDSKAPLARGFFMQKSIFYLTSNGGASDASGGDANPNDGDANPSDGDANPNGDASVLLRA